MAKMDKIKKQNKKIGFDVNDIIIDKRTGKEYLFEGYFNGYFCDKLYYVREVGKFKTSTEYTEYFKLKKRRQKMAKKILTILQSNWIYNWIIRTLKKFAL